MAMIAYAWIVFLAIAYSAKKGLFMKLDVISSHYSEKTRNALDLLMNVILFLACLFFFVLGIRQLQEMIAAGEVYKETGIPMGVIYLAPIVGYGLALLRFIVQALGKKSR